MTRQNTGEMEDFDNLETVTIPKEYYDRLMLVAKFAGDRLDAKDAMYSFEKDLEKALHKLKPGAGLAPK